MLRRPIGFGNWSSYRTYLVLLLAIILAFNGLDRTALGLVLPDIKTALQLTDTELGVLTGIAFSFFYSTVGLPLARWADQGDRVAIIALTTALWGIMVMLIGYTSSFSELLIVRVGVAVGEAGCLPAAYSLIADYFSREERPRAVSNYLLGANASVIVGFLAAGWLSAHYGWRVMFVCIGLPSAIVAPVAWWTLSEPRRKRGHPVQQSPSSAGSVRIRQIIPLLSRNRTFRYLLASICITWLFGYGIAVWQPSFFVRSYGLKTESLGVYFAVVAGAAAGIGTYGGGYLASRFAPKNERLQLRMFALSNAGYGVITAAIYLSTNLLVSMVLLGLAAIVGSLQNGPIFATIQSVVPERTRAIAFSLIYLFANLTGAGLGPLIVGGLSDTLHPYLGTESLRYALLAMCPGYLLSGWLLWHCARNVVADSDAAGIEGTESNVNCAHV